MNKLYFFVFLLISPILLFSQIENSVRTSPLIIGETLELYSSTMMENREINIYLPPYYREDSLANYPVIYLLDGGLEEDFIHISGIIQFGSFSWINMVPESIVVGISNVDRKRDFTSPAILKEDQQEFPTAGKSELFISFLQNELIPLIDANYRTNENKTIIGQSLGGLLCTEILLTNSSLFTNYIIISPSLWWNNESLLYRELPDLSNVQRIFIGVGKEGDVMEKDAEALYKKLKVVNHTDTKVRFKFFESKSHGDVLHISAYEALEWIFKNE